MNILRKKENVFSCAGFIFFPGINNVPDGLYEDRISKNPAFTAQIECGNMEVLGVVKETKTPDAVPVIDELALQVEGLVKLQPKEVIAFVKESSDMKVLSALLEAEDRQKVQTVIEKRIAELSKVNEPDSETL